MWITQGLEYPELLWNMKANAQEDSTRVLHGGPGAGVLFPLFLGPSSVSSPLAST